MQGWLLFVRRGEKVQLGPAGNPFYGEGERRKVRLGA